VFNLPAPGIAALDGVGGGDERPIPLMLLILFEAEWDDER
jgi:hypothetical protein